MSKKASRQRAQELYDNLIEVTTTSQVATTSQSLAEMSEQIQSLPASGLLRMKKFRFQLMYQWLVAHFEPRRVADVGGGKGLLSYLLQQSGWQATVIDPVYQDLPDKYKDIVNGKRMRIPQTDQVPHLNDEFAAEMTQHFDLVVGMHAHGCNAKIIDGAKAYGREFILMPCCVIDEPMYPRLGVGWLECLVDYALRQGFAVYPFRLHFKGQNIGFYGKLN